MVEVLQIAVISVVALVLGWRPRPPASLGGACSRSLLGTAAFAALGLFVAGVLRAEATLAAANLVYLLLLAGGAVVLPQLVVRRASAHVAPLAALRRPRRRDARTPCVDGTVAWRDLARAAGRGPSSAPS